MQKNLDPGTTISSALERAANLFSGRSETARLDAGTLIGHVLGRSRAWIVAHPETRLSVEECRQVEKALEDISDGIPLPYFMGHWEFYGLDFDITREVLIPRPETELLVEMALNWLKTNSGRLKAADIGTGSGCIAVSLAVNLPDLKVYASDISKGALQVAGLNIKKHGVEGRVHLLLGDLLTALPENVDVLCANLPYIPHETLKSLPVAYQEPRVALDGGADGLDHIRRLIAEAYRKIARGGLILLEIEARQASQVVSLAHAGFPGSDIQCHQDLAGKDRLVSVSLPGESDTISVP